MSGEVYRFHHCVGPRVPGLDVFEDCFFGECIANGRFVPRIDGGALDVELRGVERDAWYFGSILGVDGLMVNGFMISVAVELGVEVQVFIVLVIILVAFDVGDEDGAW